jgi:lipoate-protein ligase A
VPDPPPAPWRLILDWDVEPGRNMALDEALLLSRDPRPTLRLYTWSPAALSLGYFQRWDDVRPALELAPGATPVRRMTGGGAIHHADELTFAITAPLDHPLYRGPVADSYRRVHTAIAGALARLGPSPALRAATPATSDRPASPMCFHRSVAVDLVWDGAKGLGSAQRRTGGRVLHHGSLKIGATPLEPGVATLRAHVPDLSARALAAQLIEALGPAFAARFDEERAAAVERAHADRRAAFFRSPAFLRRR